MAKLLRLGAHLRQHPRADFLFLDGRIDDLTPWAASGGHGTVSGIPNFAPLASTRLWKLLCLAKERILEAAEQDEAARIQSITSKADVSAVPGGIRAMSEFIESPRLIAKSETSEYALAQTHGYPIFPRRPLLPLDKANGKIFMEVLGPLLDLEKEYEAVL